MANLTQEECSKFETFETVTALPHQDSTLNGNCAPNSKAALTTWAGTCNYGGGTPACLAAAFNLIGLSVAMTE